MKDYNVIKHLLLVAIFKFTCGKKLPASMDDIERFVDDYIEDMKKTARQ